MLGERIASQPEVIRAIVSVHSPCCGVPRTFFSFFCARFAACSASSSGDSATRFGSGRAGISRPGDSDRPLRVDDDVLVVTRSSSLQRDRTRVSLQLQ